MKVRTDHLLHALASFAIAIVVTATLTAFRVPAASVWAAGVTITAGLGKEAWDYLSKRGTAEVSDLIADLAGLIAAIACFMCLGL